MTAPGISLYIPCYNAAATLAPCLQGIAAQTRPPDEVIVVDDGSTDATVAIAVQHGARILSHGSNRGLGAGRNTAVREARHEWIASIDSDCVPQPDWLQRLAARLDADPGLAGVGGRLEEMNRTSRADAWRTNHMRQHWGPEAFPDPAFLFGNNNLFRKKALLQAGLYNEKLRTNFEDVAMSEALRAAGYRLFYDGAAVVSHLRRDTIRSVLRANWRWRFFGYRNDIGLRGFFRGLYLERWPELRYFLHTDLLARDAQAALLSCAAVGYAVFWDFRYLLQHRGERRIHETTAIVADV